MWDDVEDFPWGRGGGFFFDRGAPDGEKGGGE